MCHANNEKRKKIDNGRKTTAKSRKEKPENVEKRKVTST